MENTTQITPAEDTVDRNNVSKFYGTMPEGYERSAKKMTEKSTARLKGYWLQTVSINEKRVEMSEDTEKRDYAFDHEWLCKYQDTQWSCFAYLRGQRIPEEGQTYQEQIRTRHGRLP